MMRLAIFSAVLALATAQQVLQDPIKSFCRRHKHQTCVIDSKLYVDGGLAYYGTQVDSTSIAQRNTWLLWGDLSDLSTGLPPLYSNLTKSSDVPTVSGGVLWPDNVNKLFYLFGGVYPTGSVQSFTALWFYDTIYNKWDRALSDGSQAQISWPAYGASAVTDGGVAYYYGGYLSADSVSGWTAPSLMLNSLVSYDMGKRAWTNRTDGLPRAEGILEFIPASDMGMLIYFGGVQMSSSGAISYANMSQIQIFDIANSRWYTQTATGEIPRSRRGFCSGAVWAEDYSSYNIYIFGGIASDETAVGDLYILSLPSFTWIPYPDSQPKNWVGGKAWASCSLINKSQMIVMSGFYTNSAKTACDAPTAGGQHSLLLGQESVEEGNVWRNLRPDVTKYRVPGNITEIIGGSTEGNATLTAPAVGWATSDLFDGFQRHKPVVSRAATRSIPESSASAAPTSAVVIPGKSDTNVGAIAGGVAGGAVLLIGITALVVFCLRSRRRKRDSQPGNGVQPHIGSDPRSPTVEEKSVAHFSMSQGSTMYSPNSNVSGLSPYGTPHPPNEFHSSPPYNKSQSQHQPSGSDWTQSGGLGFAPPQSYQQTYYPPPQDPAHSPYVNSAELPDSQTPMQISELPEIRSPKPIRELH